MILISDDRLKCLESIVGEYCDEVEVFFETKTTFEGEIQLIETSVACYYKDKNITNDLYKTDWEYIVKECNKEIDTNIGDI